MGISSSEESREQRLKDSLPINEFLNYKYPKKSWIESVCKPSFVRDYQYNSHDGHSSSIHVTMNIKQSTRSLINANNISEPIRSCTGWGLQVP